MLKAIVHFTYPKPMKTKESNPEVPENQRSEPKRYKHRASRSKTQSPMASQNKHVLALQVKIAVTCLFQSVIFASN